MQQLEPISSQIWDLKYRLKTPTGEPVDETIEDTWRRVAEALAVPEEDSAGWSHRFYSAMEGFKFLPAGRILAGAGTERRVTLFNCYVMGCIEDDLGRIFDHLREAALTMQQGGGIGYDFSSLRPKGAPVVGVGSDASGPLSFMDVWDSMCKTIMSAGTRRGAMMAVLRCDHPDIEAFIEAKREPGRLRNFNMSVLVTDAFMAAVQAGDDWPLQFKGKIYRTLRARELFDKITRATYDYAEPGVLFIDRINEQNNLSYCEMIYATNPCGEQPLPPYGACLLGSINLASFVRYPFSTGAHIDVDSLQAVVAMAVRMLDNTIEVSNFPLPAQRAEAFAKRRLGLGLTGVADALIMLRHTYGSPDAVATVEELARIVNNQAYRSSAHLAKEKGRFPLYSAQQIQAALMIDQLLPSTRELIRKYGLRNGLLTSIAPTGTISLVANNISSGIEPVFALSYTRKVLQPDGTRTEEEVSCYALRKWRELHGDWELPSYFVTAQDLTPQAHVTMQAAVQRHVDSAISKTVNVPASISFEDFQQVYHLAYELGCKGCTTYRPNDITGSVLEVKAQPAVSNEEELLVTSIAEAVGEQLKESVVQQVMPAELLARGDNLQGNTYKLRWEEHALYVTINHVEVNGQLRPLEIFVNSKNLEHYAWVVALTRMISAVFRRGGEVAFVVDELKQVFDPRGGQWSGGRYVPSLVAALGEVLERHLISIGYLTKPEDELLEELPSGLSAWMAQKSLCPKCSQPGLTSSEGCLTCHSCGWSKCS